MGREALVPGTGRDTLPAEGGGGAAWVFFGGRKKSWNAGGSETGWMEGWMEGLLFILQAAILPSIFSIRCFGSVLCNLSGYNINRG